MSEMIAVTVGAITNTTDAGKPVTRVRYDEVDGERQFSIRLPADQDAPALGDAAMVEYFDIDNGDCRVTATRVHVDGVVLQEEGA